MLQHKQCFSDGVQTNRAARLDMVVSGKKIRKLNGSNYLLGAHHPHCKRHHNHLIWVFNHPFCLGCSCMYSGIALGSILAISTDWTKFEFFSWVFLHLIPLIPTAFQPWLQRKPFKIVSRLLLGTSLGSYLLSGLVLYRGIFNPWVFKILVLLALFIGCKVLISLRQFKPNDPCTDCPLGVYPTCEWNISRLLAANDDVHLGVALGESINQDKLS